VSWLALALLALAVAVIAGAEWPRLEERFGGQARRRRQRQKQKESMRLLRTESEKFEASVQRDLSQLPTVPEEPRDRRRSS
jgi:hypothetical protein